MAIDRTPLVFSCRDDYFLPTLCMLDSLKRYNQEFDLYYAYYKDSISPSFIERLKEKAPISIHEVAIDYYPDPSVFKPYPSEVFLKLAICYSQIPLNWFLWCDSDIIFRDDVAPFCEQAKCKGDDLCFYGVEERFPNQTKKNESIGVTDGLYLNAGFIMINACAVRKVFPTLVSLAQAIKNRTPPFPIPDQDAINVLFNGMKSAQKNDRYMRFSQKKWLGDPQYVAARPSVIHFAGPNKPWAPYGRCSFRSCFWKYGKKRYSLANKITLFFRRIIWFLLRFIYKYLVRSDKFSS